MRSCGEMGVHVTPLAGSSYDVREPPGRGITAARAHKEHVAARVGPQARSDATKYLRREGDAPPSIRRSSLREASRFLRAPFQIGAQA